MNSHSIDVNIKIKTIWHEDMSILCKRQRIKYKTVYRQ